MTSAVTTSKPPFEEALDHLVLLPWQMSNEDAPRPWSVPDALRLRWMDHAKNGKSAEERIACAVGLCRAKGLSNEEVIFTENFFFREDLSTVNGDVLGVLIGTGGTPPGALWTAYLQPQLRKVGKDIPPILWLVLAWYLRSPNQALFARTILDRAQELWDSESGKFLVWESLLNPMIDPETVSGDLWSQAAKAFHPRTTFAQSQAMDKMLTFAHGLRWDNDKSPTTGHDLFNWLQKNRRFFGSIFVTQMDIENPPLALLQKFSGRSELCEVYRFYHPLLRWPWEYPSLPGSASINLSMALCVAGHPPFFNWLAPRVMDKTIEGWLKTHPFWGCC